MHEGIYIAASGAFKQERKMDVIANNLANQGNSGFKRDGLSFREMIPPFTSTASLTAGLISQQAVSSSAFPVSYVAVDNIYTDASNGTLRPTGNTLDVGLAGEGFFVVDSPNGQRYTRNGNFKLAGDGSLTTQEGYNVLGEDGKPLKIPANAGQISINASGGIAVGSGLQNTPVGNFKLVSFDDLTKLQKQGDGLFKTTDPAMKGKAPQKLTVQQGVLEASNVNSIEEMTEMITTLRAFEAYQKIIQSIDQADDQAVNSIGRVA
jgi:flagellar basal-body rod protein FlgF